MNRIITVTGDGIANPGNFRVKVGTNYGELIEAAGGFTAQPEKVIAGGPMYGNGTYGSRCSGDKDFIRSSCIPERSGGPCEAGKLYPLRPLCKSLSMPSASLKNVAGL